MLEKYYIFLNTKYTLSRVVIKRCRLLDNDQPGKLNEMLSLLRFVSRLRYEVNEENRVYGASLSIMRQQRVTIVPRVHVMCTCPTWKRLRVLIEPVRRNCPHVYGTVNTDKARSVLRERSAGSHVGRSASRPRTSVCHEYGKRYFLLERFHNL